MKLQWLDSAISTDSKSHVGSAGSVINNAIRMLQEIATGYDLEPGLEPAHARALLELIGETAVNKHGHSEDPADE